MLNMKLCAVGYEEFEKLSEETTKTRPIEKHVNRWALITL
jgi:hypothetical protein